jgi:hypothetical protein
MLRQEIDDRLSDRARLATFEVSLGLACTRKAWPVWEAKFREEPYPLDVAHSAEVIFESRQGSIEELRRGIGKVKTYLDSKLILGEEYFPAVCAGFSAWAVARDVVSLLCGSLTDVGSGASELEVTPEDWSPCFFASLAISGGAVWDGQGDPDVRHEFWAWYLAEAVPQALVIAED